MVGSLIPSGRFAASVAVAAILVLQFPLMPGLQVSQSAAALPGAVVPGPTPSDPSPSFGAPGDNTWINYPGPSNVGASGEPTLGVNWVSGNTLYRSQSQTLLVEFNDAVVPATVEWTDVSDPLTSTNLDPILFTDSELGRTFSGGIAGCGLIMMTDDDGVTWNPTADPCALPAVDHETIASGPIHDVLAPLIPGGVVPTWTYPHAVYYCAQTSVDHCWISYDGGVSYVPTTLAVSDVCQSLHGHLRIATDGDPTLDSDWEGTAYLPNASCGSLTGMMMTVDNGDTWDLRTVPGSFGDGRFDPGIGISHENGWLYFGQGEKDCACIGLSTDEGLTWEDMGVADGAPAGTDWYDVSESYRIETGIDLHHFEFADLEAGDDDRVAFSFLASELPDPATPATDPNDCIDPVAMTSVWNYYVAVSYDAGDSWHVTQVNPLNDPVQVGVIYNGQDPNQGTDYCRNLLDFFDMQITEKGRIQLGWVDGCVAPACDLAIGTSTNSESSLGTITRQATGCGLFREFDTGGNCNGIVVYPPLVADALGPYAGPVSLPIALVGTATGGKAPYTCSWAGTGATFSSPTSCTPTIVFDDCKPHTVFLTVTDDQYSPSSSIDTAVVQATGCPDLSSMGGNDPHEGGETPYPQDSTGGDGDLDEDDVPDHFDNCPRTENADQSDIDGDSLGDECDSDMDGDGYSNLKDDCPRVADPAQRDTDADGLADRCDADIDNDAVGNDADLCVYSKDPLQSDIDQDKLGDVCDGDRDGDGIPNELDAFPDDASNWTDLNHDQVGDQTDASGAASTRPTTQTTPKQKVTSPTAKAPGLESAIALLVLLGAVFTVRRRA